MCTLTTCELFDYKSKIVVYKVKSKKHAFVQNIIV